MNMEYEIVELKEKTVAGLAARTNNFSSDMSTVIGSLWTRFYMDGIYGSIENKVNDKALGIYTDYAGDEKGDYTILVAAETADEVQTKAGDTGMTVRKIPGGIYAKFIVKGDLHKTVSEFWQELWRLDLPRSFVSDFEEYQNNDTEHAEIHMYIGLNKPAH